MYEQAPNAAASGTLSEQKERNTLSLLCNTIVMKDSCTLTSVTTTALRAGRCEDCDVLSNSLLKLLSCCLGPSPPAPTMGEMGSVIALPGALSIHLPRHPGPVELGHRSHYRHLCCLHCWCPLPRGAHQTFAGRQRRVRMGALQGQRESSDLYGGDVALFRSVGACAHGWYRMSPGASLRYFCASIAHADNRHHH